MSVGEKLKKLRLNMKKTLKDQSEQFNVSVNSVYRWEHDLATPRKNMLKRMAEYYDVPLIWLLHENADEESQEEVNILNLENGTEQQMLKIYRKLSANSKYKILGYLERVYIETMNEAVLETTD